MVRSYGVLSTDIKSLIMNTIVALETGLSSDFGRLGRFLAFFELFFQVKA